MNYEIPGGLKLDSKTPYATEANGRHNKPSTHSAPRKDQNEILTQIVQGGRNFAKERTLHNEKTESHDIC